jgi:hypothetical protein
MQRLSESRTIHYSRRTALLRALIALPLLLMPALVRADDASLSLATSNAAIIQTSNTAWSLSKTGAIVPATSTSTVDWTITATQGAIVGGNLVVTGFMDVANTGKGAATIGNIVVNLQAPVAGRWVTESSDIADSTSGGAATTAHVVAHATSENASTFTENAASGPLAFMDRASNTMFSLVPAVNHSGRKDRPSAVFSDVPQQRAGAGDRDHGADRGERDLRPGGWGVQRRKQHGHQRQRQD